MLIDPDGPPDARAVAGSLLDLAMGRRDPRAVDVLASPAEENGGVDRSNVLTGLLVLITSMPEYQLC